MDEIWRPIPIEPYFGVYEASSLGRFRRLAGADCAGRMRKEKIIKSHSTGRDGCFGYKQVALSVNRQKRFPGAHIMICMAFHGLPPTPEHNVNHKNGVKSDNSPANLEWVTKKENSGHAVRMGLLPSGERHYKAKLTEQDVLVIRARREAGETVSAIHKDFPQLGYGSLWDVIYRKSWKHI